MKYCGRRFVNINIKFRFPKYQLVRIINPLDTRHNIVCEIIGWTATRVILKIVGTDLTVIRVPKNLGRPYRNPLILVERFHPY